MSGSGGYKHRKKRLERKRARAKLLARRNAARAQSRFAEKGERWEPSKNPIQAQALNHAARRMLLPPTRKK
jgi:hypothetical protein